MSIDWAKAEEAPDKAQKVEGKFLLDLRAKVNDLEKQLTEAKSDLSAAKETIDSEVAEVKDQLSSATLENTEIKHNIEEKEAALNCAEFLYD